MYIVHHSNSYWYYADILSSEMSVECTWYDVMWNFMPIYIYIYIYILAQSLCLCINIDVYIFKLVYSTDISELRISEEYQYESECVHFVFAGVAKCCVAHGEVSGSNPARCGHASQKLWGPCPNYGPRGGLHKHILSWEATALGFIWNSLKNCCRVARLPNAKILVKV